MSGRPAGGFGGRLDWGSVRRGFALDDRPFDRDPDAERADRVTCGGGRPSSNRLVQPPGSAPSLVVSTCVTKNAAIERRVSMSSSLLSLRRRLLADVLRLASSSPPWARLQRKIR
jgi:hypothetical protein